MRRVANVIFAAAAAASLNCSYNPPPVAVVAAPRDRERLVGTWSGEYETNPAARTGSILFHLGAGRDTAYGDVVMVPRASVAESQLGIRAPGPPQLPRALSITFVRVNDRDLEGKLDLYLDPDLGARVETLFRGAFLNDSTLGGTFVTRGERGKIVRRGKWNAARTNLSVRARP